MSNIAFKTLSKIAGPLIFVEGVNDAAYGEIVEIKLVNGDRRQGQVLDTRQGLAIVQVFGPTYGRFLLFEKVLDDLQPRSKIPYILAHSR